MDLEHALNQSWTMFSSGVPIYKDGGRLVVDEIPKVQLPTPNGMSPDAAALGDAPSPTFGNEFAAGTMRAIGGGLRDTAQGVLDVGAELIDNQNRMDNRPQFARDAVKDVLPNWEPQSLAEGIARTGVNVVSALMLTRTLGMGGSTFGNIASGAVVDMLMDPTEGNLSTLARDFGFDNELTQFLDNKVAEDAGPEERLRARMLGVLEGAGLGALIDGVMRGFKVIKDNPEAAAKVVGGLGVAGLAMPQDAEGGALSKVLRQTLKKEGGLNFPAEDAAERLRLLEKRRADLANGKELPGQPNNERFVISAPEGSDLPDFVIGKITPQDWIARTEKMLSPEEIQQYAKWYDDIRGVFLKYTNGDEALTDKYMRAWLVAQQNIDVTGAMNNVLLQAEQFARNTPADELKAGGMPNPTGAARSVLKGEDIEGGVGQKIADFVDSAEGKDVRSWMGNDERGGSPFVVDIHTARDTGLVDDVLVNHLRRLGYDVPENLKMDFGDAIASTKYENRAQFGREMTDYLNSIQWQGRSDWKPREVQAIGWMAMTKLTANQADDVVTGLEQVTRRISFEAAPGVGSPWAAKFGERFNALPLDKQASVTQAVTTRAMDAAREISGIDLRDLVHGTGGWNTYQNPAAVGQALATREGAEIAANVLGYLTQQTEVWVNSVKGWTKNPKAFAVDFIEDGSKTLGTDDGLRAFWQKIMDSDSSKLMVGYQPIRTPDGQVGIRVLIDKGGAKRREALEKSLNGAINDAVGGMDINLRVRGYEADLTKVRNDWETDKDGQAYLGRLADLGVRRTAADFDTLRRELEGLFESELGKAEGRPGPAAGSTAAANSPKGRTKGLMDSGSNGPPPSN